MCYLATTEGHLFQGKINRINLENICFLMIIGMFSWRKSVCTLFSLAIILPLLYIHQVNRILPLKGPLFIQLYANLSDLDILWPFVIVGGL